MCAMGHSHTRFIPLVVLIMSAFYLLCKARSTEACNKPASPVINLQDWSGGFRPCCHWSSPTPPPFLSLPLSLVLHFLFLSLFHTHSLVLSFAVFFSISGITLRIKQFISLPCRIISLLRITFFSWWSLPLGTFLFIAALHATSSLHLPLTLAVLHLGSFLLSVSPSFHLCISSASLFISHLPLQL